MPPSAWSLSSWKSSTWCISEPIATLPDLKWPHVHHYLSVTMCLLHLSLDVIRPLEIYFSWSDDAPAPPPGLSAVGCLRLVHARGFLMPGWSHPYSPTHLEHFLDSPPQRHTQEPPVAASQWTALKTVWCHDMLRQVWWKKLGEDTGPWYSNV